MIVLGINDLDVAEKYIGCTCKVKDIEPLVLLLSIYSNGYMTSGGFYHEVTVAQDDIKTPVLYKEFASLCVPATWPYEKFKLANSIEGLAHSQVDKLYDIDFQLAATLQDGQQLLPECGPYIGKHGERYNIALWVRS